MSLGFLGKPTSDTSVTNFSNTEVLTTKTLQSKEIFSNTIISNAIVTNSLTIPGGVSNNNPCTITEVNGQFYFVSTTGVFFFANNKTFTYLPLNTTADSSVLRFIASQTIKKFQVNVLFIFLLLYQLHLLFNEQQN